MQSFRLFLESDELGFLAAIAKNPRDNAIWLIFADWLEEQNDKRADIIRFLTGSKVQSNLSLVNVSGEFARLLAEAFPIARYAIAWKVPFKTAAEVMKMVEDYEKVISHATNRRQPLPIAPQDAINNINSILYGTVHTIRQQVPPHGDVIDIAYYIVKNDINYSVLYDDIQGAFYIMNPTHWHNRIQQFIYDEPDDLDIDDVE